jgi:hypothetical protein
LALLAISVFKASLTEKVNESSNKLTKRVEVITHNFL